VIIMGGAVTVSAIEVGLAAAALPLLVGIALAAVGRGRRSWING
jgi:hypothetical protein